MFNDLARLVVLADDLEVATHHYVSILGRQPSWRSAGADHGDGATLFRLENTTLELRSALDREGVAALVFGCDDIADAADALRSRGLETRDPVECEARDEETGRVRRYTEAVLAPKLTRGVKLVAAEDQSPDPGMPFAEPAVDPDEAVIGLDHVVVSSRDLDASRQLYGEGLGLRLALDRSFEKIGSRMLFFRIAGVTVEVVGSIEAPAGDAAPEPDRLGGLAWKVPDVPGVRARLLRDGFDVSEDRPGRKPGTRVATVRSDTHGVPTLLIGPG